MSDYNIVIAERGWVYVGITRREGDQIVISDCNNIRRWGTSRGLGEIALKGPTSDTVLDFYGNCRVYGTRGYLSGLSRLSARRPGYVSARVASHCASHPDRSRLVADHGN